VRFLNRAAHFDADLELVDVFSLANIRGSLHTTGGKYLFDDVRTKHTRLAGRANTSGGRVAAITHLKSTLFASYIKDLYEDAISNFAELLNAAAKRGLNPDRLIGEHAVTFQANEILSARSWDEVIHIVSHSVFRALENEKSTRKLLQKINTKLDLGVDATKIEAALPYFEMRHLLVHANGVLDIAFCKAFPRFGGRPGQKPDLGVRRILRAKGAVIALIEEFDTKVVAKAIVSPSDCQP
jgi:hypothetical protein